MKGHTHTIPAAEVRRFRDLMRESLAEARKQIHDAENHDKLAIGRSHLNFVCDMLDALGWDDLDPEVDAPVEGIRKALRGHIVRERELMNHVVYDVEEGRLYLHMLAKLLEAITPEP